MRISLPDKQAAPKLTGGDGEGRGRRDTLPFRLPWTYIPSAINRMLSVVLAAPALAGVFDGVLCAATLSPSKCGKITDQIFSTNGCCWNKLVGACWRYWPIIEYSVKVCSLRRVTGSLTGALFTCVRYSSAQAKHKGRNMLRRSLFGCTTNEKIKISLLFWHSVKFSSPCEELKKTCHTIAL